MKTDAELQFKPEVKRKETYWIIQSFKNKFNPQKATVYFEGLLGDQRLSTCIIIIIISISNCNKFYLFIYLGLGINKFLNDNWKVVFDELGPSFEEAFGAVFKELTHRVFSRVPIDKIFLE